MTSLINPSLPVDGLPASKADLRSNLAAAKSEIESLQRKSRFSTRSEVGITNIDPSVLLIETLGFSNEMDGGGAYFSRASTEPAHQGKVQSADGSWWEHFGEKANLRQFGAIGDGVADDTAASQNAADYCALTGATWEVPDGTFRLTGKISFGQFPFANPLSDIVNRTSTAVLVDDNVAKNSNRDNLIACSLVGSPRGVLVADFLPAQPEAVIEYNIEGQKIEGFARGINIGVPAYVDAQGLLSNLVGPQTPATNNLAGIVMSARGFLSISGIRGYGLGKGAIVSIGGFWLSVSDVSGWACGDSAHFTLANAMDISNLKFWYSSRGVVFDGQGTSLSFNTQQVLRDFVCFEAEACTFRNCYFEDSDSSDGSGAFAVTLGVGANDANKVNYCTFDGIRVGAARPNKGAFLIQGTNNTTIANCRSFSKTVDTDNTSTGILFQNDFIENEVTFPLERFGRINSGTMSIARRYPDSATVVHEDLIRINSFDYGTIPAQSTITKDLPIPTINTPFNEGSVKLTQLVSVGASLIFEGQMQSPSTLRILITNPTSSPIPLNTGFTAHITLYNVHTAVTPT